MTLYQQDLLPNIISGVSAGSLVSAALCTFKRHELPQFINNFNQMHRFPILSWTKDSIFDKVTAFVNSKSFISNEQIKLFIRDICSDLTFLEVYEHNDWILNINVTEQSTGQSILLNYLTAPNVVIWSACVASCSIPGYYEPYQLL